MARGRPEGVPVVSRKTEGAEGVSGVGRQRRSPYGGTGRDVTDGVRVCEQIESKRFTGGLVRGSR